MGTTEVFLPGMKIAALLYYTLIARVVRFIFFFVDEPCNAVLVETMYIHIHVGNRYPVFYTRAASLLVHCVFVFYSP